MNYRAAITYLLEQLPMYQRVGAAAYRTDLNNIIRLCQILGNPQEGLRCVHIAGTNGKGSVAHILASILQEQGYKTGLYVSPHYRDFRERIKLNGKYISRQYVTRFVSNHQAQFNEVNASFFEITTAMAFQYFKDKKVDIAVVEVGLGGRLDSTNIIHPLLSVITNISLDHTQFLGDTLAKIAYEKAGIIKPHIPVVIGETVSETKPVFLQKAKAESAPIFFARQKPPLKLPKSGLSGNYQAKNIRTALAAIAVLQGCGFTISRRAVRDGVNRVAENTNFIGRWMIKSKRPLVVLDSGHNEGGIKEVLKQLRKTKYARLHFVYGTVKDKDYEKVLALLPPKATYYFCKAAIPRGLEADVLLSHASAHRLKGSVFSSVRKAYQAAIKNAAPADMVLVCGSIFVVAEVV